MTAPALSVRGPVLLGLIALLALVAGFGVWAVLARLDGAIIVPGQVIVADERQVIQHPEGGVVAEVLVGEGSLVAAGEPMLRLAGPELLSEHRILEGRLVSLAARAARLAAERDGADRISFPAGLVTAAASDPAAQQELAGQQRLFDLRQALLRDAEDLLTQRIDQFLAETDAIAAERLSVEQQLSLIAEDIAVQGDLFDKGLVPQAQVLALRREAARLEGQLAALAVAEARTGGQITEARLRIGSLHAERHEAAAAELREIEPDIRALTETLSAMSARIDQLVIRAPVAGLVLGMQGVKPGVVLQAGSPILSLVPVGRPLVITARLRPEDIDVVFPGQPVELAVTAFAAGLVPRLRGRVTLIAADALTDPETGAAFYTLELALDPGEGARLSGRTLRPGMQVQAYLATGARSPMSYLLEPFRRFFSQALREG